jgi:hypothetical protein
MLFIFATAFVTISLVDAAIQIDQVKEKLKLIDHLNYPTEFENVEDKLSILSDRYPCLFGRFVEGVGLIMANSRVPELFLLSNAFRLVTMLEASNEDTDTVVRAINLVSVNMALITAGERNPNGRTVWYAISKFLDNWGSLQRSPDGDQKERVKAVFVQQGMWVCVYATEHEISSIYSSSRNELLIALSLKPEVFEERFKRNYEIPRGGQLKYRGKNLLNNYNNPKLRSFITENPDEGLETEKTELPVVETTPPWFHKFPVLSFVINNVWK